MKPIGKKFLVCKGADSVIAKLLHSGQKEIIERTNKFVVGYAEEGLRTLFLARKFIEDKEYEEWNKKSQEAKLALSEREEKVAAVDELIEQELTLLGSTAIEDRLQD